MCPATGSALFRRQKFQTLINGFLPTILIVGSRDAAGADPRSSGRGGDGASLKEGSTVHKGKCGIRNVDFRFQISKIGNWKLEIRGG